MSQKPDREGQHLRRSPNRQPRRHPRMRCAEDTHFATNRMLFEGRIRDFSIGGVYIQAKPQFKIGQDVVVAGPFSEDRSEVKRRGKIVRLNANGFAVQFLY